MLDSGDLEREKGITILAKQTTVDYDGVRLNIVDTPGHADFGGEVERSLLMVDAVLLLVDAAEGPLPQTRYVLQKAMQRHLPVIVALNKIDRSDARPMQVLDEVYELFIDLGADELQIEFPVVYTNAKAGTATPDLATARHRPAPTARPAGRGHSPAELRGRPSAAAAGHEPDRQRLRRPHGGRAHPQRDHPHRPASDVVREEEEDTAGSVEPGRTVTLTGSVTALQTAHGIDRVDITEAGPGDIVSVAGLPEVTIGDTITDPDDPRPLPRLDVDAPTLRMTFGVNTSPLAGRDGKYLTRARSRHGSTARCSATSPSRSHPTESGETFEVRGRGELQLAVLIEQMRREGYELTVSRPEVILHSATARPRSRTSASPSTSRPTTSASVQQALAGRKGRLEQMRTDADGRVRMEFIIPIRGLIGYRGQLLTDTRGTALLHQIGEGYGPWAGEVAHRTSGVLVADRAGESRAYALSSLVERSELFIGPSAEVYEGMIIGENSRPGDMDVNPTKSKQLSKMRTQATMATTAFTRRRGCSRSSRPSSSSPPMSWSRSRRRPSACASGCSRSTIAAARRARHSRLALPIRNRLGYEVPERPPPNAAHIRAISSTDVPAPTPSATSTRAFRGSSVPEKMAPASHHCELPPGNA